MTSPPFQIAGPKGEPAGISIDLVNRAARRRGISLEWISWNDTSESAIIRKQVDLWPLITITPARLKQFHISQPYLEHEHCFLVRSDSPYKKAADLAHGKIGMANVNIDAKTLGSLMPEVSPVAKSSVEAILKDVCDRTADAAFMDRYTAITGLLKETGCDGEPLRWIPIPQLLSRLGVGSTFEAGPVADAIREEIGALAAEGKLAEAFAQWGFMSGRDIASVESLLDAKRREARLFTVAVVFALMMLLACWQTWRLMRERTRTRQTEDALRVSQERYIQAQKMESIGRLAGGVAHDFNNLLTVINGYSDLLYSRMAEKDPLRSHADEIRKAGARATELTSQLLAFGRKQVGRPRPLNLNSVIGDSEKMLQRLVGEDIRLVTKLAPSLGMVMADPGHVHQILMNLTVNARDAMPDGGALVIETSNVAADSIDARSVPTDWKPGPSVRLSVRDTGSGMDEKTRKNIFEPFFSTKGTKGTGLGLATVYGIIQQNHGWIEVSSEPGQGTTFQLYLPCVAGDARQVPAPAATEPPAGDTRGSETVLVVEDQDEVREFVVQALANRGFRVLQAADAPQALEVSERHSGSIDLLLTDVVLPGMNGRELAELFRMLRPSIKVIYTSGYTQDIIASRGVQDGDVTYVHKPYSAEAIAVSVREAIDKQ